MGGLLSRPGLVLMLLECNQFGQFWLRRAPSPLSLPQAQRPRAWRPLFVCSSQMLEGPS